MLDKTYRPDEVEPAQYAAWEREGAFAAHPDSAAQPFTIMMPPPNVTGSLHMGHALNMTLQDILTRVARRQGYDALWQPGTDHAGIATQSVVERQLAKDEGKTPRDLGREAFVDRIWKFKAQSGHHITNQLRRLGVSCHWARERFTMDDGLSQAVRTTFVQLYKQGLIYRAQRLVNWDPELQTAISDLEVAPKEINGTLWHFAYPIEGDPDGKAIVVATTRPETMLGDTAVAVHPTDSRYRDLIGKHCILPLVGRRLPIVADAHADPEQGSGAVKITPAHDFNDFEVGRRQNLEFVNVMDHAGAINENAPEAYRGLDRFKARERVLEDLRAQGLLAAEEAYTHSVPYGDRSDVPIEPWLTDQWFCDAPTLAKPAIEAVEQGYTRFVPEDWTKVYKDWMYNIQPWCISRQIWWGHQIPAWYGPDGTIFVEMTEAEAQESARRHYGEAVALTRDEDVLDTWFSSALWPFSTLGWPEDTQYLRRYYPTDTLVTGFDIIFFWVARMMMMGLHFMGGEDVPFERSVPFERVVVHTLVRDAKGQKMSKSKGNILDPLDLIERYGADATRFALAVLAAPGRDIKISEDRVQGMRNFATKLWNAARYAEMQGCRPDPSFDPGAVRLTVNRWIVGEITDLDARLQEAMAVYRFNDAAQGLYEFTWHTFCDWYLEFTKPVLQDDAASEADRAETRATMAWALDQILHQLNPFMPFITEELYGRLGQRGGQRLITAALPDYSGLQPDRLAGAEMTWVRKTIAAIRGVRGEMNVPPQAWLTLIVNDADRTARARLDRHRSLIARMARLEAIQVETAVPQGAVQTVVEGTTLALPLADVIDLAAERARLEREIAKLDQDIAKLDSTLGNAQFLAKAPAAVVEDQRERRNEAAANRDKLAQALTRLAAA